MKSITNLNDLLIDQIRNLHDAELQWQHAIEKNVSRVNAPELKKVLEQSGKQSGENARRLETVLRKFKTSSLGKPNTVARELIHQTNHIIEESSDPEILDAGFIAAHQQMNHYKIANYGTTSSYAKTLQQTEVANLLHDSLLQEKKVDEELSKIAKEKVNPKAKTALVK